MAAKNPTGLKQLIQSMQTADMEMLEGTVISSDPLEIKVENDEKLTISEDITYIPEHLTTHKVTVTIPASADGDDSHTKVEMTVYNALKKGDKVHLLSFSEGKQYYVLDRV